MEMESELIALTFYLCVLFKKKTLTRGQRSKKEYKFRLVTFMQFLSFIYVWFDEDDFLKLVVVY